MAFLAGLLGGVHCVGMCGGIIAAMSWQGGTAMSTQQSMYFQLAYSTGRIASYTAAGALAGLAGSAAFLADEILPVQHLLYVLTQCVLILMGLYVAGISQGILWLERAGGGLWRRLQPLLARVMPVRHAGQALLAGALWGWLPCGLVYGILVAALAAGSAGSGALLLLAFGLGTLPNLLLMGWAADSLRTLTRNVWVRRGAGGILAGVGIWGLARLVF